MERIERIIDQRMIDASDPSVLLEELLGPFDEDGHPVNAVPQDPQDRLVEDAWY